MKKTKPRVRIYTTRLPDEVAIMFEEDVAQQDVSHSKLIADILHQHYYPDN